MKEEIKDILETGTCISHIRIQEITTKIHRLFIQKQIDLIDLLKQKCYQPEGEDFFDQVLDVEELHNIQESLQNQLDNE